MNLIEFQTVLDHAIRHAILRAVDVPQDENVLLRFNEIINYYVIETLDRMRDDLKKSRVDTLREACAEIAKIQDGFRGLKKSAATFQEREHAENIVGILGDCIRNIAKKMDEPS